MNIILSRDEITKILSESDYLKDRIESIAKPNGSEFNIKWYEYSDENYLHHIRIEFENK